MDEPVLDEFLCHELSKLVKGDVFIDKTTLLLYSTDASAYREVPLAVVMPRDPKDIELILGFANKHNLSVIPRAAGTSLAGQVVGKGIVVDVSKYLNHIIKVNKEEKWVIVEPGVVLDELNIYLKKFGLFFGPETSTSNRCNIGGMVGNNSCGTHSLVYGSTRDHLLEINGFLSNGERVHFESLSNVYFDKKCRLESLEGNIYKAISEVLSNPDNQKVIREGFPHPEIKRRNNGYAIDRLLTQKPFNKKGNPFNMCQLIAGSEGTLMFITQIKLNLVDLPPVHNALVCIHFHDLKSAIDANIRALQYNPVAIELMDKLVLDLADKNPLQSKNKFFIDGGPKALLLVELVEKNSDELKEKVEIFLADFESENIGYASTVLYGDDIKKVWSLRKAGLGVLSNMPGDRLPVPVIEDTAIRPEDLSNYVSDIQQMLHELNKECVYYAHIGTGELHLRPVLNMKKEEDVKLFRIIAERTAQIVKKYRGSLSGEHGDGRLRGEFIPFMLGNRNYEILKQIKSVFDPLSILNPGKIVDTPPMDTSLRYSSSVENVIEPYFRWDKSGGLVQGADKCTGSADCRKSSIIGGAMCPSFMATRNEKDSTRARANILREFFTGSISVEEDELESVLDTLDLCLSCKACKQECPSGIDMTKLKAEFLNYYHSKNGISIREKIFAYQPYIFHLASKMPEIFNFLKDRKFSKWIFSKLFKLDESISLPDVSSQTLVEWYLKSFDIKVKSNKRKIFLVADEFLNYSDEGVGQSAVKLLIRLGYRVEITRPFISGRTYLSKGILDKAKSLAEENINYLLELINEDNVIVGIEPSAILTLRDEYLELVSDDLKEKAEQISQKSFVIEEFIAKEMDNGNWDADMFVDDQMKLIFHAHCYQKALSDTNIIKKILEIPHNYTATEIKSGCCGMAGAFGYEKEHASIAKKIGELVLFPSVRSRKEKEIVVVSGMSCRHHLKENTGVKGKHPVEVLYEALKG